MTSKKWLKSREKENWDAFVENCPTDAKKCDKVPNWARRSLGLTSSLGRVAASFPLPLQHLTDELLLEKMELGMELSPAGIADLIRELVEEYNLQVKEENEAVASIPQGDVPDDYQPLRHATCKLNSVNLDKMASRFCTRFGWGRYKNEKPGKHLEFNDPKLVAIRRFVSDATKAGRVHPRLICNFDQIWTLTFEPLKRIAFKKSKEPGEKRDGQKRPQKDALMGKMREAAGRPPQCLGSLSRICKY